MSYEHSHSHSRSTPQIARPPLKLVRPEPPPIPNDLFDARSGPQPFWPRLSRAVALVGIGAVAHTFLPANITLPSLHVRPTPSRAHAPRPRVDRTVLVEQATVFAPFAPGVMLAAPSAPALALAPATPVAATTIAAAQADVPAPVGTFGAGPAEPADAQPLARIVNAPDPTLATLLRDTDALGRPEASRPDAARGRSLDAVQAKALDDDQGGRREAQDRPVNHAQAHGTALDGVHAPAVSGAPAGVPVVAAALRPVSRRALPVDRDVATEPRTGIEAVAPVDDERLVRRLLEEYTGAFERLDVTATKAVWPSVDDRKLKRAYEQLSSQHLSLQSCGITISGRTANARCQGSATYQPKIGTRAVEIASREWMFDLSKQDAGWHIVNTMVR